MNRRNLIATSTTVLGSALAAVALIGDPVGAPTSAPGSQGTAQYGGGAGGD